MSEPGILLIHIVCIVVGTSLLFLGVLVGVLLLLQNHYIKNKSFVPLVSFLPSINRLDKIVFKLILVGFPFMTVGLLLGIILAHQAWPGSWGKDPIVIFSIICWFWYALLLSSRLFFGWRGRRLSLLNMVGVGVILFTLFGLKFFFGEANHTYF